MSYRLRDDVSFCRIDDHLVFLDLQEDRYFRLAEPTENALISYMSGCGRVEAGLYSLIDTGLLIEGQPPGGRIQATFLDGPARSALEEEVPAGRLCSAIYLEVLGTVFSTRWRLKRKKLKQVIDQATARQHNRADSFAIPTSGTLESDLLHAVGLFRRARQHVPIGTSCLLDSLSLLQFLARRGLPGRLVFGVTLEPFSAHCWIQVGNLALNETVGEASAHTPIRVLG